MNDSIAVGFQAYTSDRSEEFGAIRAVSPDGRELTVYVENNGDFTIPATAVVKVAFGKVTFDCKKLEKKLRQAIGHAHDAETE
ncbi:MAG: hypothetical protein JWN44_5654 [Myxococcales bacterium]|nr:hypothetical protein [Myxococcales bacterium]